MSLCEHGEAERLDSAYQLFERLADDLREANSYRAVLPEVVDSRQLRLCHSLAVDGALDVELLIDRDRLQSLGCEYPSLCAELADMDALRVLSEPPPFALSLIDGEDRSDGGSSLRIVSYGSGAVGCLSTTDRRSIDWGERYYERCRSASGSGRDTLQATEHPTGTVPFGDDSLPLSVRSEGFVRVDDEYADRHEPMQPATAWRAGLGLPEVQAGYALPRRTSEEHTNVEWLADEIFGTLRSEPAVAVLGPPGSGKSTVCKRVACEWHSRTGGAVLYRENGRGDPFDSVATLRHVIERERDPGPVLVVVEDAVRADAHEIFTVIERVRSMDDVAVLLDARESEWTDPEEFPIDARLEGLRQESVEIVHVPRLEEAECERLVERVELIADRELPVSPATLLEELRETAHRRFGNTEEAAAGTIFLLFHRLARTLEPLGAVDEQRRPATVLDEHVDRMRASLSERGETALDVGIVANLCNAAGLGLDPAYLHTPAVDDPDDYDAVHAALECLEGEMLFSGTGERAGPMGIHEAWSVTFLSRLLEHERDGAERFGRCLTRLLSLADDPDARARLIEVVGETPALDQIVVDPSDWVAETLEALFELARTQSRLAGLFVDGDTTSFELPDRTPSELHEDLTVWLARMCQNAGMYERASAAFERLPEDGTQTECERLLGLASVAEDRGDYETGRTLATRGFELARELDDRRTLARSTLRLGSLAMRRQACESAITYSRRAFELYRELGHRRGEARALNNRGIVAAQANDFEAAAKYFRQCLDRFRSLDDRRKVAAVLDNLGAAARERSDLETALEYNWRSLETRQELGDRRGIAKSLDNLGLLAKKRGDLETAREYFERSLELREALDSRHGRAYSLYNLGDLELARGALQEAQSFLERALELVTEPSIPTLKGGVLVLLGVLALATNAPDRARPRFEEALSIAEELDDVPLQAQSLAYLGVVEHVDGSLQQAREQLRAALETAQSTDERIWSATARGLLGAVEVAAGTPGDGRPNCALALAELRDEDEYATARGVEVLWRHIESERELGNDERVRELSGRTQAWIQATDGPPGYAHELIEADRETGETPPERTRLPTLPRTFEFQWLDH
jgi:tetratricopeptide (TPR) repeat protein/energy-coupling factor transporter ATP-binding protein EcfA2